MTALSNEEFMEYAGLSDEEKCKAVIELLTFSAAECGEGVSFRRTPVVSDQAHVIVCILHSLLQQTVKRRGFLVNAITLQVNRSLRNTPRNP